MAAAYNKYNGYRPVIVAMLRLPEEEGGGKESAVRRQQYDGSPRHDGHITEDAG